MEPTSLSAAKDRIAAEIDRRAGLLVDVSHQIHARPELRYEERFAHDLLAGVLEGEGLSVTRSARGVETAFEAAAGSSGPTVATRVSATERTASPLPSRAGPPGSWPSNSTRASE